MLGFFERQRLVKKGLTPQKTRRRITESEVVETLEHGLFARIALVVAFAAGLGWLLMTGTERLPAETIIVAVLIAGMLTGDLYLNCSEAWGRTSRLLLLFLILFSHLGLM